MSITETQEKIVEEFSIFDEWMDKYEYIIELGKELPLIDPKHKVDENLIKGCQSRVWLNSDFKEGKLFFTADSDAIITKGIVALVIQVFSGHNPEEITNTPLFFIDQIGLQEHLSPTRSNGLLAMIKQIKLQAVIHSKA